MMKCPRREDFRSVQQIPTRWGDVDRLGHINNAKYFTYDEQARIEYFVARRAEAGIGGGPSFILAHIACDFIEQLHHPARMDYAIRVTRIGRSSLRTEGAIFVGGRCHSRTEGVLVWFDYDAQKARPIPDALRRAVREFEIVKPAE